MADLNAVVAFATALPGNTLGLHRRVGCQPSYAPLASESAGSNWRLRL